MVKIEYENTEIRVPESWDDVKLRVYETIHAQKGTTHRDRVAKIAAVCEVEPEVLLAWPVEIFNRIVSYVDFIFQDNPAKPGTFLEIDGVNYVMAVEDTLTLGEYVDVDTAQKANPSNLSGILAIICRPTGEAYAYEKNEERAALFADQPVSKVLPLLAFFLRYKNQYAQRTAAFLNLAQLVDRLPRNIAILLSLGTGIKLFRIWPIIRYWTLTALLRYRVRQYLQTYYTGGIKTPQKTHNIS